MINYYSVVNGLKVMLGNFVIQLALAAAMFCYGKPPVYEDNPVKTDAAQRIYLELSFARPLFAVVAYLNAYNYRYSTVLVSICIFIQVYIYIETCMNFIFAQGEKSYDISEMNAEQRAWAMLMWL